MWNGLHGWGMWIWPILLIALVVWIVWIVSRRMGEPPRGQDNAEEVLRRRYAAGEIDEAEFERRLAELRRQG